MEYVYDSCVRGHYFITDFWSPIIGEELSCEREENNPCDPYAVSVKKRDLVVGHVPRKISGAYSLFC